MKSVNRKASHHASQEADNDWSSIDIGKALIFNNLANIKYIV